MQLKTTKRLSAATLSTIRRSVFVALAAMMMLSCDQKQDPAMPHPEGDESYNHQSQHDATSDAGNGAGDTSADAASSDSGSTPSDSAHTTDVDAIAWDKMDVALRGELRTLLPDSSAVVRVVFAQVLENSDALATAVDAQGVQVQTRAGTVWTLRGPAGGLAQVSAQPDILRMELSQERIP